jgi:hypothetical protein
MKCTTSLKRGHVISNLEETRTFLAMRVNLPLHVRFELNRSFG